MTRLQPPDNTTPMINMGTRHADNLRLQPITELFQANATFSRRTRTVVNSHIPQRLINGRLSRWHCHNHTPGFFRRFPYCPLYLVAVVVGCRNQNHQSHRQQGSPGATGGALNHVQGKGQYVRRSRFQEVLRHPRFGEHVVQDCRAESKEGVAWYQEWLAKGGHGDDSALRVIHLEHMAEVQVDEETIAGELYVIAVVLLLLFPADVVFVYGFHRWR